MMGYLALLLIGVALSLDSFAVSLSLGIACCETLRRERRRFLLVVGAFHFIMILLGWGFGEALHHYITEYDHWVAFVLLAFVGGKMIWESFHPDQEEKQTALSWQNTLMLSLALSIDALITGFSLAMVPPALNLDSPVATMFFSALLIGVCASTISWGGIIIGRKLGNRLGKHMGAKAGILGGVVLILLGTKIIIQHLCA